MAHLLCLTDLRALGLGCAHDISDAAFDHLTQLTALERMSLSYTTISDAGLARLTSLPHLLECNLDGCSRVSDAGRALLRCNTDAVRCTIVTHCEDV